MGDRLGWLRRWLNARHINNLTSRFGDTQTCPWCRQCAQTGDGWRFDEYRPQPFFDVLTCGVCGGTSLWQFGPAMMFMASLEPPRPAFEDHIFLPRARLASAIEKEG